MHHVLTPKNSTHRQYEALRALFVGKLDLEDAARRFGHTSGVLRNLRVAVLKQPDRPFFLPDRVQRAHLVIMIGSIRHKALRNNWTSKRSGSGG